MDKNEVFQACLTDLGAHLQSEKSVAVTEFSEHADTIRGFYLWLWKLSNSVDGLVALTADDAEPNSATVAESVSQLATALTTPGSSEIALDCCRAVYEPGGVAFAGKHRSSYADALIELALHVFRAVVAADDPDALRKAEQESSDHPRGHLHLTCDPSKVAANWSNAKLLIWYWIIQGWSGAADAVDEPPTLTKEAAAVLIYAAEKFPVVVTVEDITLNVEGCQAKATAQKSRSDLMSAGYAHCPHGPNKGMALTPAGRALADKLIPNLAQS